MQDKLKLCLLVTEKHYFHKTKKDFIQCLIVCHFDPSKPQGDGEAHVLVYCGLFCHLKQLEVTCFWLSAKSPDFFLIRWQMGKTGFYLSVILSQAFSCKQTFLAMWISYFSQDAEQLALFTFYVFTDLDKVSVHKHTKILSPSKQAWSLT